MLCPNCNLEMQHKYDEWYGHPFSTGPEDDYPTLMYIDEYHCKMCRIKNINGKWHIPESMKPTEKQIKTILFINNHLQMDLGMLTKNQCWLAINRYFEKAKRTPLPCSPICDDSLYEYYNEADFY